MADFNSDGKPDIMGEPGQEVLRSRWVWASFDQDCAWAGLMSCCSRVFSTVAALRAARPEQQRAPAVDFQGKKDWDLHWPEPGRTTGLIDGLGKKVAEPAKAVTLSRSIL